MYNSTTQILNTLHKTIFNYSSLLIIVIGVAGNILMFMCFPEMLSENFPCPRTHDNLHDLHANCRTKFSRTNAKIIFSLKHK